MKEQKIIEKIKVIVQKTLGDEPTGHDYWHALRVCESARKINKKERGKDFVVSAASLLHDFVDRKIKKMTLKELEKMLKKLEVPNAQIGEILHVIKYVSFSSRQPRKKTLELEIVQDADRLDSLGAIGIARTFAYGGRKGRPIYVPGEKPNLKMSKKEYKSNNDCSINHFHEKLLKLADLMNTKTGKQIARRRNKFLEEYLKEFHREWGGLS